MRTVIPLPCTLDGVAVPVVRVTDEFGRAWVRHDYPGRNRPEMEDMGGKGGRFSVDAIYSGPFWRIRVGALRATVETGPPLGTHTFLHPFWGLLYGVVEGLRVEHQDDQEDTARVSFTFVEADPLPVAFSLGGAAVASQAAAEAAATAALAAAAALPE